MPSEATTAVSTETDTSPDRTIEGLDALETVAAPKPSFLRHAWFVTWPKLAAIALVLAIWQGVVWRGWYEDFQLAPPSKAFPELWSLIQDGTAWRAIVLTMGRIGRGYALSLLIGIALGIAVSQSSVLRRAVGSLITGLQTMPSVAWFPLAILLFRITEGAILFVVVLGAAPSIANGLIAGIDNVPPLLLRAGRVLGAKGVDSWRFVKLPAALPYFIGGLKQGWAFAWRSLLAGELIVIVPGKQSIGFLLQTGRDLSDSALLLAAMLIILFIGIVVDAVVFGTIERTIRRRWGLLST